ncbi:MAG: hypothetical protein LBS36_00930 [Oscillospiraceae bacterium]|jgi:hypothetical protein|nr:hypothetical protein [Oscillospiraceae bacterium]
MEHNKNESASLDVIMTLLFLYTIGALVTIYGHVLLMSGERGELNGKTLAISVVGVCAVMAFSFITGLLKRKTAFYGLAAALALNVTVLPLAIYTAPVYALASFIGQRTGLHYIAGYVLYAAFQFAFFGCGYILSRLPVFSRLQLRFAARGGVA